MIKVTGNVYERIKSYFSGLFAFISAIIATVSIYNLPPANGETSQALNPQSDLMWLVVVFGALTVLLTVYTIYYFFSVLKVEFIVVDGVMEVNLYKGDKIVRSFNVEKMEFSIVVAHSNYCSYALRLLLELSVESKTGCFFLTEDLDNNNPGLNIERASFYVENYFCRSKGTLRELLDKVKSAEKKLTA